MILVVEEIHRRLHGDCDWRECQMGLCPALFFALMGKHCGEKR